MRCLLSRADSIHHSAKDRRLVLVHVSCAVRLVCIPPFADILLYSLREERGGLHAGVTVHLKTVILDPQFLMIVEFVGLYGGPKSCMLINARDVNVQLKGICEPELLLGASRRAKSRFMQIMRTCGVS